MKILLTGGAGFIGSHLAEGFLGRGYEVVVVDNLSTGKQHQIPAGATFYQTDIRSAELAEIFRTEQPQVVCHHAAQMSVLVSVREPAEDASNNILGSLNLLKCAQDYGVEQFIFASSGGTVYGEPQQVPVPESAPLLPLSPYGISKMTFEHYLRVAQGLTYTVLRYANVYGPRQSPHGEAGVIAIFAEKMLKGEATIIFGDGTQQRDFVYVSDVVAANLAAIEKRQGGTFNIGTGVAASVNEIHAHLCRILGYPQAATHAPRKAGEVYRIVLDCQLAHTTLGWNTQIGLQTGLEKSMAALREPTL